MRRTRASFPSSPPHIRLSEACRDAKRASGSAALHDAFLFLALGGVWRRLHRGRIVERGGELHGNDAANLVRSRWATGRGQSHATAVVAVEAARAARGAAAAVHHLHELLTLADLPTDSGIECHASALPALRALW